MKSRRIEFRANDHEAAQWDALAEARGMGLSDLCRALLNAEVTRTESSAKMEGVAPTERESGPG